MGGLQIYDQACRQTAADSVLVATEAKVWHVHLNCQMNVPRIKIGGAERQPDTRGSQNPALFRHVSTV